MTNEDVRSELDRDPFIPIRLHLVSGKTVDIPRAGVGFMLQNAVIVLHEPQSSGGETPSGSYNVVALRNIEMIEQLVISAKTGA
ncbi:MAG TPA: hypothetical protein VF669_21960 [Tepidisphaeraceae bacterium]